jgi:MSHA pilin protein MshA
MKKQSGFTLIELVMVIVILGVLAVTAMPKFLDLKTDAQRAALNGVAGSLASSAAINYAAFKAGNASAATVDNCNDVLGLLQVSPGTNYTVTAAILTADTTGTCSVSDTANTGITAVTFPVTATATGT